MDNSSLQCLLPIVLLYLNLPIFPGANNYESHLCVGDWINSNQNSIGKGSDEYHNNALSSAAAVASGCFDAGETDKNKWTPNYIVYKSTDVVDTSEKGSTLLGWLSVHVSVPEGLDTFAVQAFIPKDYVHFVPGDIVTTRFATGCKENLGGQDFPKKHLAPCYFATDPSATVPVAAVWAGKRLTEFRFTYRTDFPECAMVNDTQPLEFRFYGNRARRATLCNITSPMFTAPQNKIKIQNFTYGGFDPEPPRASPHVTCNTHINSSQRWVTEYYHNALLTSSHVRNSPTNAITGCYMVRHHHTFAGKSFSGRCRIEHATNNVWLGKEKSYDCTMKSSRREGPEYVDYSPENPPGAGNCQGCVSARNRTRELGLACGSAVGENIWGVRSTHGIAMVWTAMVIIPLSTLLSRYYKETLMRQRYVNMHVWYGVHAAASCTGFAGLLSGWVAALVGRLYFGFSKNGMGYLHWIFGYVSILSFLVAFFGSSVRIFERRMRLLTIFFHFLAGTVTRICWTICLLSSIFVPGSPAAKKDVHVSGFTMEPALAIIIAWVLVDVAVHLFLMVNLSLIDKKSRFPTVRTYAIAVPIPLISPDDETDFPGAGVKKILLMVHTVVGILCALLLSLFICSNYPTGRYFGPMWYTHKSSGKLNILMQDLYS